jgi:predicted aconitase
MKLSSISCKCPNLCTTYKLIAKPGFGNIISFFNASLINFLNAIFSRPEGEYYGQSILHL